MGRAAFRTLHGTQLQTRFCLVLFPPAARGTT